MQQVAAHDCRHVYTASKFIGCKVSIAMKLCNVCSAITHDSGLCRGLYNGIYIGAHDFDHVYLYFQVHIP